MKSPSPRSELSSESLEGLLRVGKKSGVDPEGVERGLPMVLGSTRAAKDPE